MIAKLIRQHAPLLRVPLDPEAILWAIYKCERYTKNNRAPRFEAAYAPEGKYYEVEHVKQAFEEWGNWAACSYSNFQILFIVALELGYTNPPLALDKDEVALPFVTKYINDRILKKGADTVESVADAYNSGTHRDKSVPWRYIRKFRKHYDRALGKLIEERKCVTLTNSQDSSSLPSTDSAD